MFTLLATRIHMFSKIVFFSGTYVLFSAWCLREARQSLQYLCLQTQTTNVRAQIISSYHLGDYFPSPQAQADSPDTGSIERIYKALHMRFEGHIPWTMTRSDQYSSLFSKIKTIA